MITEICVGGVWSRGCCDGGGNVFYYTPVLEQTTNTVSV